MPREAFAHEIAAARDLLRQGDYGGAMFHLERAHVLGQKLVWPHVTTHWLMLGIALRRAQPMAAIGQVIRMVLGALGSAVGRVPIGNTGGTNVSMFKSMPIPPDLQELMRADAPATRK